MPFYGPPFLPLHATSLGRTSPWLNPFNRSGDRKRPSCTRCTNGNSACFYPAKRRRPSPGTRYRTLLNQLRQSDAEAELGMQRHASHLSLYSCSPCMEMNNQANFRALQDRLLDQFDVEQLQRALQRRRPASQVLSQSCVDPATELPVSPGVTGFTAARNWPDVSAGVVSECSAAPSIDVDADLAFWTTLAGWDGPELNLPPMPSGRMLPLLRIPLDRTLLTRYDLAFPTGPLQQSLPIPTFVNNGAADAYDFHVPTEVVHELYVNPLIIITNY